MLLPPLRTLPLGRTSAGGRSASTLVPEGFPRGRGLAPSWTAGTTSAPGLDPQASARANVACTQGNLVMLKSTTRALGLAATTLVFAAYGFAHEGHDHNAADGPMATGRAETDKAQVDRLLVAAQKICPVTGMPLDAMGGPYRAKSGERTIFLCCKSCLGKPIKPEAWKQIQKNLAEAQGICPVMDEPLPENPASVVVEGRTVFVCCKPCIKKVKANPAKALTLVDTQLKKHVKAEAK